MRFSKRVFILTVLLAVALGQAQAQVQYAVGVVFHDANQNGIRDAGEVGIPEVKVSNGRSIVNTNTEGNYQLPVDDDTIIFITKPRGWMTPVDENNLPKFYYVHKPKGSPEQRYRGVAPTGPLPELVDFPLYPQEEPERFKIVMFGDTQPASQGPVFVFGHDIIPELVGVDAEFGVTLGDVVSNNLSLYEDVVAAKSLIGIPWHHVKGNHDANFDGAPDHYLTSETWARVFGPPYYSFEYGPVHFVVLNNPYFGQPSGYVAKLDFRQMSWLRRDLSRVPKDQLVVLMMHIPLHRMSDREEIFRMLEDRPHTFSLSAHTHTQYHNFYGPEQGWKGPEPHHHLVHAAACGAWWSGAPDEVGIPHSVQADGTPNGYSIITFDKNKYSVRYKVARRPADYQMNIWAPDEIKPEDAAGTEVLANVFAASVRSTVEMKVGDGPWVEMERTTQRDPFFVKLKAIEDGLTKPIPWKATRQPGNCGRIWKANLPAGLSAGAHEIQVRTTDMFGQEFEGRRVIHVW